MKQRMRATQSTEDVAACTIYEVAESGGSAYYLLVYIYLQRTGLRGPNDMLLRDNGAI